MLYIHVPFCKSRCIYCDFFSTTRGAEWMQKYLVALVREMHCRAEEISRASVDTIYIGGGTPSQLPTSILVRIFEELRSIVSLQNTVEITIEANPDDVTSQWLRELSMTPVNRISMGVQTLDDELLRTLNRRHTSAQAYAAVQLCRELGYDNISLDLMYGLPGQTLAMWQKDVDAVLSMKIPHLSAYSLQREEGTAMDRLMREGKLREADEELSLQMYETLLAMTENAGMEHYEISNFALPGMYSRHNSGYWQDKPYVGLGPAAHSFDGNNRRRWNLQDLKLYCQEMCVPYEEEILTSAERYNEKVLTRLRTREGLPLDILSEAERAHTLSVSQQHIQQGRMQMRDNAMRLTRQGIFTSNDIMSDFMM